jgi:hypothetical protein
MRCAGCERPIPETRGHRQAAYCSAGCKQRAYRARQEARRAEALRQQWAARPPDASAVLDVILRLYGLEGAERIHGMLYERPTFHAPIRAPSSNTIPATLREYAPAESERSK